MVLLNKDTLFTLTSNVFYCYLNWINKEMAFNFSVFISNMVDNNIYNPCKQKPFGFSVSMF